MPQNISVFRKYITEVGDKFCNKQFSKNVTLEREIILNLNNYNNLNNCSHCSDYEIINESIINIETENDCY